MIDKTPVKLVTCVATCGCLALIYISGTSLFIADIILLVE